MVLKRMFGVLRVSLSLVRRTIHSTRIASSFVSLLVQYSLIISITILPFCNSSISGAEEVSGALARTLSVEVDHSKQDPPRPTPVPPTPGIGLGGNGPDGSFSVDQ
jgi:hypothetical protein